MAVAETNATGVVSAVNFEYRGFDTVGEEFILFVAATGVAVVLRHLRGEQEHNGAAADWAMPRATDAVRLAALVFTGPIVVLGWYLASHAQTSPSGGFQGGVVLASAFILIYLSGEFLLFRRISPVDITDAVEAVGAGGFAAIGVTALAMGLAYLNNFLPRGTTPGAVSSSGTIPLISFFVGLEVAAAFVLIVAELVEQTLLVRQGARVMHIFPFVVVAYILAVGLYGVVTSRHLVHQIVCLIVVQSSTYVLLLGVGYKTGAVAPYFYDVPMHTPAVDPVVQALALTDVVVEAAVTALLLSLAVQAQKRFGTLDPQAARPAQGLTRRLPVDPLLPLAIVLPLVVAAAIRALNPLLRGQRRMLDGVAIAASAVVTVLLVIIMIRVAHHDETYWFGGFRPHHGITIGIDFEVGPLSAGLACLAAVLVTAGMVFSWRYFERVGHLLPRADAGVPGGHDGVLPHRRHLRHVRLVRADERGGLRADRLPPRRTRLDPGRAELRHHQQHRRLPDPVRDRRRLRAHRRAQHGPDRPGPRPAPAGRPGRGGIRAHQSPDG